MCVLGVGVCEALDLEVAVEGFESVQECKGCRLFDIDRVFQVRSTNRIDAVDI